MNISVLERVAFGRSWNPKVACITTLALVFLCGAVAGALAMNLGLHTYLHKNSQTLYFDRLQKDLDLTPAQAEQVQSILGDFWQYYRTVLSDSKSRVEHVLNEEQRRKFDRLLEDAQQK